MTQKVALVTGGGSGIGRATALRFGRAGMRVAVLGRTEADLNASVSEIDECGGEGLAVVADISDVEAMQNSMAEIEARWGRLDILFANAGINGVWAPLDELEPLEWDKTIAVNLRGTFLTLKYALPLLKKRGGAVVITSSVNGTRVFSNTGATAYSCTKAAQVALAKMAALELASDGIRVNVICPGAIETDIEESTETRDLEEAREPARYPAGRIPLTDGRPGSPDDVAELVYFLTSDASRHITGTAVWIDGAESLLQG